LKKGLDMILVSINILNFCFGLSKKFLQPFVLIKELKFWEILTYLWLDLF